MFAQFFLQAIQIFFDLLFFAILARVLLSWIPGFGGQIRDILHGVTEPVLGPFRRIVPRLGMIDISPLVALLVLDLARNLLVRILLSVF